MTSSVDKCTDVSALEAIILRKQGDNLVQVGPRLCQVVSAQPSKVVAIKAVNTNKL